MYLDPDRVAKGEHSMITGYNLDETLRPSDWQAKPGTSKWRFMNQLDRSGIKKAYVDRKLKAAGAKFRRTTSHTMEATVDSLNKIPQKTYDKIWKDADRIYGGEGNRAGKGD